jgi:hypothetical protein
MANANAAMLGSGLSGLGILGGIDQMALLSMQQQSAAAAAAVGGMPLGTSLPTAPLSLRPPASGPSQVSCVPVRFAALRLLFWTSFQLLCERSSCRGQGRRVIPVCVGLAIQEIQVVVRQ